MKKQITLLVEYGQVTDVYCSEPGFEWNFIERGGWDESEEEIGMIDRMIQKVKSEMHKCD